MFLVILFLIYFFYVDVWVFFFLPAHMYVHDIFPGACRYQERYPGMEVREKDELPCGY